MLFGRSMNIYIYICDNFVPIPIFEQICLSFKLDDWRTMMKTFKFRLFLYHRGVNLCILRLFLTLFSGLVYSRSC